MNHSQVIYETHRESQGGNDKYPRFKGASVRAIVIPNLEVVVIMVGVLYVYPSVFRVSLVDRLRQLLRLLMEVGLVLMIALDRVTVNTRGVYLSDILIMVLTVCQLDMLVLVPLRVYVIVVGILVTILESAFFVGQLLHQLRVFSLL